MFSSVMSLINGVIVSLCIATLANGSLFDHFQIVDHTKNIIQIRIKDSAAAVNQEFWLGNKIDVEPPDVRSSNTNATNATIFFKNCSTSTELCLNYTDGTYLTIKHRKDECVFVNYSMKSNDAHYLKASFDTHNVHIYGGPLNLKTCDINWPLEMNHSIRNPYMYIATDIYGEYYEAVLEPYWLFSNGYYIYVDNDVPLSIAASNTLEFEAKNYGAPFYQWPQNSIALNFAMCKLNDARQAHEHAIKQFLGTPSTLPDTRLVTQPIWSTFVQDIVADVNETAVMDFAEKVIRNGYGQSRIAIDHKWETLYGSLEPNNFKLDFKRLINKLKNLNFTVSLLVHPFVSYSVKQNLTEHERGYLINRTDGMNFRGSFDGPSGEYLNSTNPDAWNWFQKRLLYLRKTFGFDAFDFDNGNYGGLSNNHDNIPNLLAIIQENTKLLASLDSTIVTNVARGTQKFGIFLSMSPIVQKKRFPLGAVIPRLLNMNLLGYSFIIPSIIGRNIEADEAEMFIRNVQLSVFMPSMRFSVYNPPWFYSEKVANLTKTFVDLHANYSSYIIELMKKNVETGSPVNPPIWWISPNDPIALGCSAESFLFDGKPEKSICRSEFLLGDIILVAPVLGWGKKKRNIYLPVGYWKDGNSEKTYNGPIWLKDYPADLNILPYFLRLRPHPESSAALNHHFHSSQGFSSIVIVFGIFLFSQLL